MRVTNAMMNELAASYVRNGMASMYDIQDQVSSGLRVRKPSDDPGSYSIIQMLRAQDACSTQFAINAGRAKEHLTTIDGKLGEMSDLLHRATELVVSGSDGTKTPADRVSMGNEMDQWLEQAVSIANEYYQGEYVFGGFLSRTKPYEVARNAEGMITGVTYNGNSGTRFAEVDRGSYVPVNVPGTDLTSNQGLFQSSETDVFGDLMRARDRLLAGENLVSSEDTVADAAADSFAVTGSYSTGAAVRVESSGNVPAGLVSGRDYYVISVSPTEIRLAATQADARAGTAIDFTDAGSGQVTLTPQTQSPLDRDIEHITDGMTRVGAYLERIEISEKIVAARRVNLATDIETEGSVDIAKAMMELTSRKTAYESALLAASKMVGTSLMDYI